MPTEYKITYTYTGQGNTSANRSVAFNRFKASGDTGRNIGQITSIIYEHWHSSTKSMTWNLRGRLVFSDGTSITSPNVGHGISGNVVKFENTFTTLPTADQWKKLSSVETLNSQGTTGNGNYSAVLYWRANSTYPMRIIVTFIEEPPVYYAPEIKTFDVTRCNANHEPDDEGAYAIANLALALGDASGVNASVMRIYYAGNAYPVVGESDYIDLTARIPELLTGVTNDPTIIPGEWSAGTSWYFAAVFIAGEESAVDTNIMPRAMSNLHISGKPNGGVCVCGYSSGTTEKPKFESYAEAYFYGGIHGVTNYSTREVDTGGRWIDGKKIYRNVIPIEVTTVNTRVDYVATLPNVSTLIDLRGSLTRTETPERRYPTSFWYSDSNYHFVWLEYPDSLSVKTSHAISGHVIIEYTKSEEAST